MLLVLINDRIYWSTTHLFGHSMFEQDKRSRHTSNDFNYYISFSNKGIWTNLKKNIY